MEGEGRTAPWSAPSKLSAGRRASMGTPGAARAPPRHVAHTAPRDSTGFSSAVASPCSDQQSPEWPFGPRWQRLSSTTDALPTAPRVAPARLSPLPPPRLTSPRETFAAAPRQPRPAVHHFVPIRGASPARRNARRLSSETDAEAVDADEPPGRPSPTSDERHGEWFTRPPLAVLSPSTSSSRRLLSGARRAPPPASSLDVFKTPPNDVPAADDDDRWFEGSLDSQPKCGFERLVANALGSWGNVLARWPRLIVVLTILAHLALAYCSRWARFDSDSHTLYIAHNSKIAGDRRHANAAFGAQPSPFIVVLRSTSGVDNVMNFEFVDKLFRLHLAVYHLEVPFTPPAHARAAAAARAGNESAGAPPAPSTVSYPDICARRFVHVRKQTECIVVSPLQLWLYSREMLDADQHVSRTLSDAYREHLVDLGGRQIRATAPGLVGGVEALIASYYLDVELEAYADGRASAWEEAARATIAEFVEREGDVHVSYWSSHYNEEEASRFVRNDAYLIGVSFAAVLVYVALTLSQWGCDAAQSRYLLACSAIASSGLALASSVGLSALARIPITPISPLICFTLLGVSVDDMIILTDAFDRIERDERARGVSRPPGARAIGGALYEIGGAVTMTTLTTAATFMTGWSCDLPIYAFFCASAALSMLALYHIQMTLFAALLLLDARRRFRLVERRRADADACASAHGARLGDEAQARDEGDYSADDSYRTPASTSTPALPKRMIAALTAIATRRSSRVCVLLAYVALVAGAFALAPHVKVGLPQRDTIADDSEIGQFLDDLDGYWSGLTPTSVMLVFKNTNVSDVEQVRAVQRVIGSVLALPFVQRTQLDWIERFGAWCACSRAERGNDKTFYGALPPPAECALADFLADGELRDSCGHRRADSSGEVTCADNDKGFKMLSGGHSCASAVSHCDQGLGWHTVQRYCPLTCAICKPKLAVGLPALEKDGRAAAAAEPAAEAPDVPYDLRELAPFVPPFSALGGRDMLDDVVLAPGADCSAGSSSCVLAAHRIILVVLVPQVYVHAYVQYEALSLPFELHGVDGYAYQVKYEFACMDARMMQISMRNLLTAAPAIGVCVSLFLDPLISLLAVVAVASIDVLLFGVMALTGMPLNVITLLSLLIALGLAIDYSCHLGHAYQHAEFATRREKVAHALDTIGISIFNAGGSTLLGTLFIAASQSALFRIFFMFVWGTIALGLLCGLVVIPAALASIGPVAERTAHNIRSLDSELWTMRLAESSRASLSSSAADDHQAGLNASGARRREAANGNGGAFTKLL